MQTADRLAEYTAKRDFTRTREPRGRRGKRKRTNLGFFVQKHDARRLHYDLRLEWDGVLLSWAVTRGPSPDPGQKRLAVRTEDHPLSYAEFEGTIPKKEYGGGTVMLWDKGTWEPQDDDPEHALAAGKLAFVARGARMRGGWVLVRMRPRAGEKRENWLLIKQKDEHASDDPEALVLHYTHSIASQRTMKQIANADPPRKRAARSRKKKQAARPKRKASRKGRLPPFMKPQLATLTDDVPEGTDWIHESKFDGYRCLVAVGGGKVRCYTRSGRDWTDKFAEIAETLAELDCDSALLDGEVVAPAGNGSSQFSALQSALSHGGALGYFAFDLLHLNGDDLLRLPLVERKAQLKLLLSSLPRNSIVRYSEHVRGSGPAVFEAACSKGIEGIVSKKADAPYSGRRTRTWLKIKCTNRQEFVIGGYSISDKRGRPFSSLLVGTYDGDRLIYRGRVGTGFSAQDLTDIAVRARVRCRIARRPLGRSEARCRSRFL
jgi:bifunctional non-homologous end joining protein LigD